MALTANQDWLYKQMSGMNVDLGSEEQFAQAMQDESNRQWVYEQAGKMGIDLGTPEQFASAMQMPDVAEVRPIQQSPDRITNAFAQMSDPLYSGQYQYHQQVADKEAQMQREEQAQLPITERDRQLQEQIRQKEIEGKWGKPNGTMFGVDSQTGMPTITNTDGNGAHLYAGEQLANQDEIDALKGQLPSYLTREVKTPQDLLVNTAEAWSSNTEMGRDFKDMLEAGTITPEEYKQAMIEANQDYINQQTRILGQKATNATIADISKTINPIIGQLQAERQKAIERAAGQGQMRGGAYGAIGAQMSANTAYDMKKDAVLSEYLQAQQYLVDAIKISEAAQKGQGFWKGLGGSLGDVDTWDMGISQLVRSANLKKIVEKYEKKPDSLTDSEKALMDAAVAYMSACAYNSDKLSRLYKAGQTTGESLPFMLQFAVMPIGAIKDKVAKGILGYGIEQFGGKALQTAGKYTFGRAAAETGTALLGNIAAAGVQTAAFGAPKIAEGTISRITGDIKPEFDENGRIVYGGRENQQGLGEALWNAGVDTYVENLSEMILTSGDPIKAWVGGTNLFKNLSKNETIQVLAKMGDKWSGSTMGKIAGRMQFRNYPEEVAEEYVGNLLRWGMSTDVHSAAEAGLDADSQIDLWIGLAPTSIAFAGLGLGEYSVRGGIDRFQSSQAARKLRNIMLEGEERKYLDNLLKSRDSDEFKFAAHDVVKSILRNNELSVQEKRAYLDNLYVTYQSQLALEAEDAKIADEVKTEVQGITNKNNGYVYPVSLAGDPDTQGHIVAGYVEVDETDPSKPRIGNDEIVTVKLNDGRVVQLNTKELDLTGTPQMAQEVFNARAEERINTQRVIDQSKNIFHQGDVATIQVPNEQTGETDEFASNIVSVSDEGVEVEVIDPTGQVSTTIIPHDVALQTLTVVKPNSRQETPEEAPLEEQQTTGAQQTQSQGQTAANMPTFVNGDESISVVDNQNGTYTNPATGEIVTREQMADKGYAFIASQPTPAAPQAPVEQAPEVQQPEVQQPEVQEQAPAAPVVPNIETMSAADYAGAAVEYMGSREYVDEYLDGEIKKVQQQLDVANSKKVGDVTDMADFKSKKDAIEAEKKALQGRLDKLTEAREKAKSYLTIAEREARAKAEAERRAAEEAARIAREQAAAAEAARLEKERIDRELKKGVPDFSEDNDRDARNRGFHVLNGQVIHRQEPLQPLATGKAVTVQFAKGQNGAAEAHHVLIPVSMAQPSHINGQRNPAFFISEAQPKDRRDQVSKVTSDMMAQNIHPDEIVEGATAYVGAPVLNGRGEAVQGNNRLDALIKMYQSHPESVAKYKQYLIDNAEALGYTEADIETIRNNDVIDVRMLDNVTDEQAIQLGQKKATDLETGGVQLIDPQVTANQLGDRIQRFSEILLRSEDDEATLADLTLRNGRPALEFLQQLGIISDAQMQSAFDSRGNITAEAKAALHGVLKQVLFQNVKNDNLPILFDAIPLTAQKAILQTIVRDLQTKQESRLAPHIQEAIEALYDALQDNIVKEAKTEADVRRAMQSWASQIKISADSDAENLPGSEKFSNFARELATLFKYGKQTEVAKKLNAYYDAVQGTTGGLFGDTPAIPYKEAIKQIFGIDYKSVDEARREKHRKELTDYLNTIADEAHPFVLFGNDNFIELLTKLGASQGKIDYVKRQLALGKTFEGFKIGNRLYLNADGLPTTDKARSKYVHERQHLLTTPEQIERVMRAASKDDLDVLVERLSESDGAYSNEEHDVLSEEFISFAMEVAYDVDTDAELEAALKAVGVNDELINIIKEINNEQRANDQRLGQSERLSNARRHASINADTEGRSPKDRRDTRSQSAVVGEEGLRPARSGSMGTGVRGENRGSTEGAGLSEVGSEGVSEEKAGGAGDNAGIAGENQGSSGVGQERGLGEVTATPAEDNAHLSDNESAFVAPQMPIDTQTNAQKQSKAPSDEEQQQAAQYLNEALQEVISKSGDKLPKNITIDENTIEDIPDSVEMTARLLIDGKPSDFSVTIFDQSLGARGGFDPVNMVKFYPREELDKWDWDLADRLAEEFNKTRTQESGLATVMDESDAVYFFNMQAALDFAEKARQEIAPSDNRETSETRATEEAGQEIKSVRSKKTPSSKKSKDTLVEQTPKNADKIEDVGEKIGGARKDIVQETVDRINVNGDTFAKIFPKFDYHKLIANGLEPRLAAGLKYVCEHAKKSYKIRKKRFGEKNALEATRFMANYAKGYLLGDTSLDFTSEGWVFTAYGKRRYEFGIKLWESLREAMGDTMFDVDLSGYDCDVIQSEEERKVEAEEKGRTYRPSSSIYYRRNADGESVEFTPRYAINTPKGDKLFTAEEYDQAVQYFQDQVTSAINYQAANPFELAIYRKRGSDDCCVHAKIGGKWVELTPWGKEYGLKYRDEHRAELQAMAQRKAEELKEQRKNTRPEAKVELRLTRREDGTYGNQFQVKLGKEYVPIKDDIMPITDSYNYLREHREELTAKAQELLNAYLDEQEANRGWKPQLNIGGLRNRVGTDWRNGADVTAERFRTEFGFRGVEFGNYVTQKERQRLLNECFDALHDMAEILGVSPRALSLNGQLGFAIGARGGAGAKAHYEPGKNVINLTKKNGWGALAHEWWHAMDYYFGKREKERPATSGIFRDDVRKQMQDAFASVMKAINGSEYLKRSQNLDAKTNKRYYAEDTELGARAFEDYIAKQLIERGQVNDFLSHHTAEEDWNGDISNYPYPIEKDGVALADAFQAFFDTVEEQEDESTGNSVLFSVTDKKYAQFALTQANNPMLDDVHTGIRSVEDIHTLEETLNDDKLLVTEPDWEEEDIRRAIEDNQVTIYSSKPIQDGTFVTPSRMVAEDYAGGEIVYEKTVSPDKVAWIASDEGQYADVDHYDGNILFSITNANNEIFYSNAERAVEGIKQDKATPEQWRAMIEKAGGLKAGEDKWIGLSDWLAQQRPTIESHPDETPLQFAQRAQAERKKFTISKQEILHYIRANKIQIEETEYGETTPENNPTFRAFQDEVTEMWENVNRMQNGRFNEANQNIIRFEDDMQAKYGDDWRDLMDDSERNVANYLQERRDEINMEVFLPEEVVMEEMCNRHGDDFQLAFSIDDDGSLSIANEDAAGYYLDVNPINDTRLQYTTEGLTNKHEIAMTVPTIEAWNESDEIHFGDAGEGKVIAWARFGDAKTISKPEELAQAEQEYKEFSRKMIAQYGLTYTERVMSDSERQQESDLIAKLNQARKDHPQVEEKVLVIDEIQSKRHQEGREYGYVDSETAIKYRQLEKETSKAQLEYHDYRDQLWKKYENQVRTRGEMLDVLTPEEKSKHTELQEKYENLYDRWEEFKKNIPVSAIPAAPFEKNWHELAMKRILRFAAENGYDKVAWTTGDQQAARYNIGEVIDSITRNEDEDYPYSYSVMSKDHGELEYDFDENGIYHDDGDPELDGKSMSDVFGKELAKRLQEMPAGETIDNEGLRIGGEGMRGFYDDILPRFMQKYGKKWGVQVGEVTMPQLEDGYQTMHAIDINDAMRESVLEGQPMFSISGRGVNGTMKPQEGETRSQYIARVAETVKNMTPRNTTIDDAIRFSITVNHNSPYLLKRADGAFVDPETGERLGFDHRFMGKGEGGQAHGWGSYFSVNDIRSYGEGYGFSLRDIKDAFNTSRWQSFGVGDAFDVAKGYLLEAHSEKAPSLRKWLEDRLAQKQELLKNYEGKVANTAEENLMVFRAEADVQYIPALLRDMVNDIDTRNRHHYDVEIPDNDGTNYFEEDQPLTQEQIDRLRKAAKETGIPKFLETISGFLRFAETNPEEYPFRKFYSDITDFQYGYPRETISNFLKDAGFVGIHYDGHRDGECYVIFDENDAVITDHIRFAISGSGNYQSRNSIVTEALVKQANDSFRLMQSALRKVSADLRTINAIRTQQFEYDRKVVNMLLDLYNSLLQENSVWAGYMPDTTRRIATQIVHAIGKKDISAEVNTIMDHMVHAQAKAAQRQWDKLRTTPVDKINISGVVMQGKVALQGQHALKALNEVLDPENGITLLTLRGDHTDPNKEVDGLIDQLMQMEDNATDDSQKLQYKGQWIGYEIAAQYLERIQHIQEERKQLDIELQAARSNRAIKPSARQQLVANIQQAMRDNYIAQADAYAQSAKDLAEYVTTQEEQAKDFIHRQDANRDKIRSYAQRDLEGLATNPNRNRTRGNIVRQIWDAFASPIRDLQSLLRLTGLHAPDGEGYLYNHFMRGWMDGADKERLGIVNASKTLDAKISELTHGKYKTWEEAARKINDASHNMFTITMLNGVDGKDMPVTEDIPLSAGNALYIYAVNKMNDGRMKLAGMNITEEDVKALADKVREQFGQEILDVVDWVQSEYFLQLRNRYNPTHEALFGAPMDAIENYFPLRINANARQQNEDLSEPDTDAARLLAGTSTGAIKRRTRNSLPLDVRNADFFQEVIRHISQMERWNAFAQWNRDANILFSDINFRNRIKGMKGTIYGEGDKLYNYMKDAFRVAIGTYKPKTDTFSEITLNMAKGVTSAKINFRIFTALKQIASFPAFFTYMQDGVFVGSYLRNWLKPHETMKWAKENLPNFEKRVSKRDMGDMRLMQRSTDWQWNKRILEWSSKYGMFFNVFFDTLTCATGARAVYDSHLADYMKKGYSEEDARNRARQDAEQAFNTSQQSSEGAFMSAVQQDRNLVTAALTVFRTSPIQYTRNFFYHTRNLLRKFQEGRKEEQIAFRMGQYKNDGLNDEQARKAAEKDYNKSIRSDIAGFVVYGALLNILWRLVGQVPYLLFGDDDDKKKKILEDATTGGALVSPITGLIGGSYIESALDGNGLITSLFAPELPFTQDAKRAEQYLQNNKYAEFANQALSVAMQSGTGFDPQTAGDVIQRIVTTIDSEEELSAAEQALRISQALLSIPQSQYEQQLIDRVVADDSEYDAALADYIRYQKVHTAPLTWWLRGEENDEKAEENAEKRFDRLLNERDALHNPEDYEE